MTELSNVATVLLARMESHPKDFEYGGKFYDLSDWLERRCIGAEALGGSKYNLLPEEDIKALTEAYKKRLYTVMEAEVMRRIFEEPEEAEKGKWGYVDPRTMYQNHQMHVQLQNQMMAAQMAQPATALNQAAAQGATGLGLGGLLKGIF